MQQIENVDNKPVSEDQIIQLLNAGHGVFEVTGMEGDVKSTWDPNDAADIEEARRQFERLTKEKKYRAYKVNADGSQGEPMKEFQPIAGRIIFVGAVVGG